MFLLSSRPKISGVGRFNPPPDLLSGAILPSIGSFAFFYKDKAGEFQTYFSSANQLSPPTNYSQRNGRLLASVTCKVKSHIKYDECLAACGNQSFASSLYRLEIGSPCSWRTNSKLARGHLKSADTNRSTN